MSDAELDAKLDAKFDAELDAWIDAHFDEQVRFLQELVRVPTDTPPGDNAPHAERTAALLQEFGFTPDKHAVPAATVRAAGMQSITNLIVRRPYASGGRTIALNAHGDVVPPGDGWTQEPYGAAVVDGKLYGRASAVSKSDFATYTFAVRALEAVGAAGHRVHGQALRGDRLRPALLPGRLARRRGCSHRAFEREVQPAAPADRLELLGHRRGQRIARGVGGGAQVER